VRGYALTVQHMCHISVVSDGGYSIECRMYYIICYICYTKSKTNGTKTITAVSVAVHGVVMVVVVGWWEGGGGRRREE